MRIELQVCSLKSARRLKKLGIAQVSLFKWTNEHEHPRGGYECNSVYRVYDHGQFSAGDGRTFAAFTASELGILLPPFFPTFVHENYRFSHCENYRVDTFPLMDGGEEHEHTPAHKLNKELIPIMAGGHEAESRAIMLIYLIENNFITAEECNLRFAKAA